MRIYRTAYVGLVSQEEDCSGIDRPVLFCDPLTTLVAYPSFEEHLIHELPTLTGSDVHLAIGDVDGLREYVTERRSADSASFGHLAGNDCMRRVGAATGAWAARIAAEEDWNFQICGTFGGDEVIVAASGVPHERFHEAINELCAEIRAAAPRPCSFALGSIAGVAVRTEAATAVYRRLVSRIDENLFDAKEKWRAEGIELNGRVTDIGYIGINTNGGTA